MARARLNMERALASVLDPTTLEVLSISTIVSMTSIKCNTKRFDQTGTWEDEMRRRDRGEDLIGNGAVPLPPQIEKGKIGDGVGQGLGLELNL